MGQKDTDLISHDNDEAPTTLRSARLDQIINEMDEEEAGQGYSVVTRTGVFTDKITVYSDPTMTRKRTETLFTRSGPFLTSVVKKYFDDDTGTVQVSSVTVGITRNANNQVADVTVTRSRP